MLRNGSKLINVHPRLSAFAISVALKMPFDVWIAEGERSIPRQAELYAQGRTSPGAIVTNALPDDAPHVFGLALDLYPSTLSGSFPGPEDSSSVLVQDRFAQMAAHARAEGLVCGADFGGVRNQGWDKPHYELPDWKSHKGWKKTAMNVAAITGLGFLGLVYLA